MAARHFYSESQECNRAFRITVVGFWSCIAPALSTSRLRNLCRHRPSRESSSLFRRSFLFFSYRLGPVGRLFSALLFWDILLLSSIVKQSVYALVANNQFCVHDVVPVSSILTVRIVGAAYLLSIPYLKTVMVRRGSLCTYRTFTLLLVKEALQFRVGTIPLHSPRGSKQAMVTTALSRRFST